MSSTAVSKVKCGICLFEKEVLKVLHCGHKYCLDCCTNLQSGTDVSYTSDSAAKLIICPSCQDVTQLHDSSVDQLATSVTYTVACFNCNVKKQTTAILWCHECNLFVCSNCLIDKHVDSMSNTVHNASKWDSHLAIISALGGLSQNRLAAKKNSISVKFVAETYVDSLKSYLRDKVDKQLDNRELEILGIIDKFSTLYSIETESAKCAPIEDFDKLRSILIAAANVAKLSVSVPLDAKLIEFHRVPYQQLQKSFFNENPYRSSYWQKSLSLLSNKLIETENVTSILCKNPCDILRYDNCSSNGSIFLDSQLGLMATFHDSEHTRSVILSQHSSFGQYGRCAHLTSQNCVMLTFQMVNASLDVAVWVYGFMKLKIGNYSIENVILEHIYCDGSFWPRFANKDYYKPLMVNENLSIFASSDDICAVANKTIYIYNDRGDKEDFEPFFTSDSETTCFSEIGDIVSSDSETLTFYICNNKFNRIDLLTFSDRFERKLVSWRQVSLAQLCPEVTIFPEPKICRLPGHGNCYLLWDRSLTKLILWEKEAKTCKLVADLINRTFQNIVVYKDHSTYFISKDIDTGRRLLHRIQL